jgi:glycosyltransferase involved in cell wall biosynthesis
MTQAGPIGISTAMRAAGSVSVIIPTRDRWPLVQRALASVFAQTVPVLEVNVVDDGSVDGTAERLAALEDPRVNVIRLGRSRGAPHARNIGIDASRGRFIAFLDSDDEWLPTYIETVLPNFDQEPTPLAVCSGQAISRPEGDFEVGPRWSDDAFEQLLSYRSQVCIAIIADRKAIDGVWFDESLPAMEERDFLISLSRRGPIVCSSARLYRTHADGGQRVTDPANMLQAARMYIEKYQDELRERPTVLADHYYRLARWHQRVDDSEGIRVCLRQAARSDPHSRRLKALSASARLGPRAARAGLMSFLRLARLKRSVGRSLLPGARMESDSHV